MKVQNGFTPLAVLFISVAIVTAAIGGFSILFPKKEASIQNKYEEIPSFSSDVFPSITSTPSSTPTSKPYPAKPLSSPTPVTATINVIIGNNGTPINDTSIYFFIRNESSAEEQIIKNTNSTWSLSNMNPGKYKLYVSYSYNNYMNIDKNCDGCQNKADISSPGSCGYTVDLHAGDNIKLFCEFRTSKPLSSQPDNSQFANDTTPPNTNIYYPQPNGFITYKIDGKVCAIATQPNDNSGPEGIETEYKFDNDNWSGYAGGRAYLCADSLPNGQHTLAYHSKDKAGNVESAKTLQFTVNIPGN